MACIYLLNSRGGPRSLDFVITPYSYPLVLGGSGPNLICSLLFPAVSVAPCFFQISIPSLPPAVLPSRSALSDLGLIADLFEKMFLNWSSFCLQSPLFGHKSRKSLIFPVLASHKNKKKNLENFLKYGIFQNRS